MNAIGFGVLTVTLALAGAVAAGTVSGSRIGPKHVEGKVSAVDPSMGTVSVASATGTVQLRFPPETIRNLKKGNYIGVDYVLTKGSAASADHAPVGPGANQIAGTVARVDHKKGWVEVNTDQTQLTLRFPAKAVRDLKEGDPVTVGMSFTRHLHGR
jgi:hypothetical protein